MERNIVMLSLDKLVDFSDHPYKVLDDEAMDELCESVKTAGVLVPIIVRAMNDGKHEIISGHRRKRACEKSGLDTIPAFIANLNDDVLNRLILDSDIAQYKLDERKYAIRHIDHIKRILPSEGKQLYVMDRGYPSMELIIHLLETRSEFVIRLPKITFKREQLAMETEDEIIDVSIDKSRINPYKGTAFAEKLTQIGRLKLRFTKIKLSDNTDECLISNLDQSDFTADDIKKIYGLRWRIEGLYYILNNKMFLSNFSGTKPDIIKQDFYATIFLFDLISDLEQQQFEDDEIPYDDLIYKVNDNRAIGTMKRKLIELIMAESGTERGRIYKTIVKKIQSRLVKIKEGRHYNRYCGNVNKRESSNNEKVLLIAAIYMVLFAMPIFDMKHEKTYDGSPHQKQRVMLSYVLFLK